MSRNHHGCSGEGSLHARLHCFCTIYSFPPGGMCYTLWSYFIILRWRDFIGSKLQSDCIKGGDRGTRYGRPSLLRVSSLPAGNKSRLDIAIVACPRRRKSIAGHSITWKPHLPAGGMFKWQNSKWNSYLLSKGATSVWLYRGWYSTACYAVAPSERLGR